MGTQVKTIGRVPQNRGDWTQGELYYKQNIVYNEGSSFIATIDNPTAEPTATIVDGEIVVSAGWQLHAYGNLETNKDVADIKSGVLVPPYAGNIKSWAERSSVEITDEWDAVPVRTTAGNLSVNTAEGAHLIAVKSQGKFKASAFKASPFNLIIPTQVIGNLPLILVPKCTFGTFGTADENNGILVTGSNGVNKKVTVWFRPYKDGVPSSATGGTICPYQDVNGYRFYLPPEAGYIWSTDINTTDCVHIAWSKDYDKYEAPSTFSTIDFNRIMSMFTMIGSEYYMLAVNVAVGIADQFIYNGSAFQYTKNCGYDNSAWTNTQITGETTTYRHEKTISTMFLNGLARDYADGVELHVEGTKVWYEDSNPTSSVAVVYQLATPESNSHVLPNAYLPNDMGCEYIEDMVGEAVIVTTYMQGLPDEIAAVPTKLDNFKSTAEANIEGLRQGMTKLGNLRVRNLNCDDVPKVTNVPMILQAAGAPSESLIPIGWDEEKMGEWTGVPYYVGQLYIDTSVSSGGLYYANGDSAVSNWKKA